MLDFGYVALDISGAKPEDAGTYTLVAKNALGKDETKTQMKVAGDYLHACYQKWDISK